MNDITTGVCTIKNMFICITFVSDMKIFIIKEGFHLATLNVFHFTKLVQKNIELGFGVLKKKFKIIQTPVRLHYVDDIFYIVKLCTCLHNAMVVHPIESGEDPETEDTYNAIICNGKDIETCQIVEDDAHNDIQSENKFFAENQDNLNLISNAVDLESLEKYKRAQFLGHRLRVINM